MSFEFGCDVDVSLSILLVSCIVLSVVVLLLLSVILVSRGEGIRCCDLVC